MKHVVSKLAVLLLISMPAYLAAETYTFNYTAGHSVHMMVGKKLVEVYGKLGDTVNLVPVPNERAMQNANSGVTDGIVANTADLNKLTKTTYPNLIMVPKPVWYTEMVVYSKTKDFTVNGWGSLKPYKIGYLTGSKWFLARAQGMNIVQAPDLNSLFKMLDAGRVDVLVLPKDAGDATIKSLGLTNIKTLSPAIMRNPLYHYLNKKHKAKIDALVKVL